MGDYVYDQGWSEERTRLAGIEAMWDDGSHALLTRCGAVAGASVLEVGAGGGSLVRWLAEQVGPRGRVLATDIDVRFVTELASDTVEVVQADVVNDDLPVGEFDVVHTRLLLQHLSERERVLDRLIAALRPGGCLVVEDYDWTAFGFDPGEETERRATDAILAFMTAAGFQADYGRRLVSSLSSRGLTDVAGEGRSRVIDSSHPGFSFFSLSFVQLAPAAVQAGLMTQEDADEVGEKLTSSAQRVITPTLVAAFGRRPG